MAVTSAEWNEPREEPLKMIRKEFFLAFIKRNKRFPCRTASIFTYHNFIISFSSNNKVGLKFFDIKPKTFLMYLDDFIICVVA